MSSASRKSLSLALGCALLMLLGAAALLWWANTVRVRADAELRGARQMLNTSRERYRQTVNEEQLIRDTIVRFESLGTSGLIGQERRLDWADEMRSLRTRLRLASLEFELAPQRKLSTLGGGEGSFSLAASQMQLHAKLLHEGDFFELMAALRQPASALVTPRRCTLTPSDDRTTPQVNLRAECTLDWLTLTPPAAPGEKR